jgi:POT family proton-dependent oligopeptide transporter
MVETPTADSPAEPDISHVNPVSERTWMGHPRQLARLFSIEMWERFGFYGMRALLVLYLVKHFLLTDHQSNGIVGGYLSLVYLTPVIGGWLADHYLGSKRSVKWGAIVMAVGYFLLCFGGHAAKPYVTIGSQRYDVTVERTGSLLGADNGRQYVAVNGRQLEIHGQPDGSVQLVDGAGQVAQTIAKADFKPGAERSPFYVALMLVALSVIVIGNGFFKPISRRSSARSTRPATGDATPASRSSTGESTSARSAGRSPARSSSTGSAGGRASSSSRSACWSAMR